MSSKNQSKKSKRKAREQKAERARVKLLNATRLEPKTSVVTLLVKDVPEAHLSTWARFSKFMGWS